MFKAKRKFFIDLQCIINYSVDRNITLKVHHTFGVFILHAHGQTFVNI